MYKLSAEQVSKYQTKMKTIAPDTNSGGTPRPDFKKIASKPHIACIIGCLPAWGLNRYFDISSQGHMDELVQACANRGSSCVKWYYLSNEDVDKEDMAVFKCKPLEQKN